MAATITQEGGSLKVDKGTQVDYYPLDDISMEVDTNAGKLILLRNQNAVDSFLYADITSPAGATIEDKADAIAAFLSTGGGGGGDATAANQTTMIGHLDAIEKGTVGSVNSVTSVAGSASSVQLLASNTDRTEVIINNDSSATLYVKLGTTASTTSYTYKLLQDDVAIVSSYTGRIDGIWGSATGNARITEID